MTAPVDVEFSSGTTISSAWLNGVNDYVNELNPADHSSENVEYVPAGTGAVATNVQSKLREFVSVKDFGAVCDGVTNDWNAIQAANEYLKANGGGTLYFPGWCYINAPFYFYGSVNNGWINNPAYPNPYQPMITWASNGQGGIRVGMTSGDVLRFSNPNTSTALTYNVGFKDFVIDCNQQNVTAVNGQDYTGATGSGSGANHYVQIDNLLIQGIQGANAIGVDFGTITDSKVKGLCVQGWGTGPYACIRLNKADVQLIDCHFVYGIHNIVIGTLAEACVQMFGGSCRSPKQNQIYWEAAVADSKSSASVITGAFLGETNTTSTTSQGPILGALAPATLDIGDITFVGCVFDNWTASSNLMNIDWGGKFTFVGCNTWGLATGNKTLKFGQYCYVSMVNNSITVDTTGPAYSLGQITYTVDYVKNTLFTPALSATGSTFNYNTRYGWYTKVGNVVTVNIRVQLATTGNTLTANALTLSGLPYLSANNTFQDSVFPVQWHQTTTPLIGIVGLLSQNSTTVNFNKVTAAAITSLSGALLASDLHATNGTVLEMTFSYFAAN